MLCRVHEPPCCRWDSADDGSGGSDGDSEGEGNDKPGSSKLHLSARLADCDFDDSDSFRAFYGHFRASAIQLIQEMSKIAPLVLMAFGAARLTQILTEGSSACCGLDAPAPLAQEAILTFVEQIMSATPKHSFCKDLKPATAGQFAAAAESMLRPLLALNPGASGAPGGLGAIVLEKQLHCIARFAPFLAYHLELLPQTMVCSLTSLVMSHL